MRIYFHIDELSRDAIVASGLHLESSRRGWPLFFGNRDTSQYLKHFNSFDAIILPSLEHYKTYFPDPLSLPSNIYILPTEAVGQATGTLRKINAKYFGNNDLDSRPWHRSIARFLLWGHAHIHPFEKYHPEYLDRCVVVGHPRLSANCIPPKKTSRKNHVTVGLVSRFGKLNPYDQRSNMSLVYEGMRDDANLHPTFENSPDIDIEDLIYTEAADLRVFMSIIRCLMKYKDVQFSIKPYPREDITQWSSFIKRHGVKASVFPWDLPFSVWLSTVDYIISPPSTSFYDMIAQDRVPICIDTIVPSRALHILSESDDNNQILRYVPRPKSVDEIANMILNRDNPVLESGYHEIFAGQTAHEIAQDSHSHILNAIATYSISSPRMTTPALNYRIFCILSLIKAYAFRLIDVVRGRHEQSASFYLTNGRISWIKGLSRKVISGKKLY